MSKDWTAKDLVSYSITMIDVAAPDFFKGLTVSIFEELDVDPLVVNGTLQSPDLDITLYRYFKSIATLPSSPHVVTTEFCRRTLELLNYPDRGSDLFISSSTTPFPSPAAASAPSPSPTYASSAPPTWSSLSSCTTNRLRTASPRTPNPRS